MFVLSEASFVSQLLLVSADKLLTAEESSQHRRRTFLGACLLADQALLAVRDPEDRRPVG